MGKLNKYLKKINWLAHNITKKDRKMKRYKRLFMQNKVGVCKCGKQMVFKEYYFIGACVSCEEEFQHNDIMGY